MAIFNVALNIPDDKVADFKLMIDERLSSEFGKHRINIVDGAEVVTPYLRWIEILLFQWLKAEYIGWKNEKADEQKKAEIAEDVAATFIEE